VGASLLVAAGLPEFVTESLEAYRERLLELVAAPAQLAAWREHLEQGRKSLPLWDTVGFARDLEALLEDAYIGTIAARQHSP
jgi:protein O-GlcNAc transferase